jgi:hypothetical protein
MARPTKHASKICLATTVVMAVGALAGLATGKPMWMVAGLLPATIYEVYRAEGESTSWASWALLAVLILEGVFLWLGIDLNLADILGADSKTVAGYNVPLGQITVVGPLVMAVLSTILIVRTRGRYTRWLAAVILVGAVAMIYVLDPTIFGQVIDQAIDKGLDQID